MKIGIDIRVLMDSQFSGVSLYAFNLIKAILASDKKNSYRLFYNSFTDLSGRMPNFSGPNVSTVNSRWPNKIFNYLMQKSLKYPRVDLSIGADLFFMPHINFISLSPNCPKIITVHDLSYLRYPAFFSSRKNIWHKLINVKQILSRFDAVIAVSENTKKDIIELAGVDEKKIKVIYSGLGGEYQRVAEDLKLEAIKLKYNLPERFILFLGTIEPRKNISGVIKAFEIMREENRDLPDYNLVIAGARGWESDRDIKSFKNSRYKEKIKFIGYVDEDDKPSLYSLADLFVYPSFYEGFGFPPLEALACGCPTIVSNGSCLPEILNNAAILVNPFNISEISRAMIEILASNKFKKNSIKNAYLIKATYNWQTAAQSYLQAFMANI